MASLNKVIANSKKGETCKCVVITAIASSEALLQSWNEESPYAWWWKSADLKDETLTCIYIIQTGKTVEQISLYTNLENGHGSSVVFHSISIGFWFDKLC